MEQQSYSSAGKSELDELRVAYAEERKRINELSEQLSKAVIRLGQREEELFQIWLKETSGKSTQKKERAAPFKFSMAKVPQGATLVWVHDPKITCTVYDEHHILYNGEKDSLSGLARKLKNTQSERGPDHWLYKGETLQARRKRFEK